MQGISSVGSVGSSSELAMAYQVRVLTMQKDAMNAAGEAALKLIESATVLPQGQGANLNIRV